MDIRMPVMDGITATKLIRTELQLSLPIIALTAVSDQGQWSTIREAGFNTILSKPTKVEDLAEIMLRLLS
jgi:CheY-like chemotaxis protein